MGIVLLCALQDGRPGRNSASCGGLIAQPVQAFLPPQHRQHVEDTRRGRPSGQRRPQRLGYRAKLEVVGFREGTYRRLGGLHIPWRTVSSASEACR